METKKGIYSGYHQLLSAKINWANTRHTSISVYNRGAFCGNLVVLTEDAEKVLAILTEEGGRESGPAAASGSGEARR